MIQAVNNQYPQTTAPQPATTVAQPVAVAQQAPVQNGYYYQYPQASVYPQQPQANAVNINIVNPQAFAAPPQSYYMPTMQQPAYAPQAAPVAPAAPQAPEAVAPAPVIPEAPQAAAPEAPAAAPQAAPAAPQTPEVVAPQAAPATVDVPSFAKKLHSEDLKVQSDTIEEIAKATQETPDAATAFLDTQIMEGLLSVIAQDTTKLEGPSPKQLELRQKLIDKQTLTPEETAEASKMTPMEVAERNKEYAIYTIAFLQNLLVGEVEKKTGTKLDIKDLPAAEQITQTAKSNPNPLIRASALTALTHIARPEYKAVLTPIFEKAKEDANEEVKKAANDGLKVLTEMK